MAARYDSGSMESYGAVQSTGTGVTVPDAALLFTGDFSRSGTDLVLTGADGAKFVVTGYFETDTPPSLLSPQGAMLTGDVVSSLAGPQFPGMYAQAGDGVAAGAKEIGKVQTLDGSATVVRANGVTETLNVGDPVFEGDVVQTGPGSKLGIGFLDGTVFSMSANARMVLNKLVYNPDGSDNSMLFSLVEGSFVFAAGKIAPTGDMKIQTPVATMGIRGTAPTVDINSESGTVNFSIIPDPGDGHVGNYTLYSLDTGQPIGTISSVGTKWVLTSADGTITELEKSEDDLLKDAEAVNQINQVYNTYTTNTQNQQNPQAGPENNNSSGSGLNTNPPANNNIDGNGNTGGDGGEQQQQQQQDDGTQGNNTPPPGDPNNDDPPPQQEEETQIVGQTIIGTPNVDVLNGTEGDDVIDGKESGDFIFANGGNDTIVISDDDGDVIDGGAGTDTILVEGDLSLNTRYAQIEATSIEIIDLNTTHANELTISAFDIANANDNATLTIIGGGDGETTPKDKVNLSPEFYIEPDEGEPYFVEGEWVEVTQPGDEFRTFEFYESGEQQGEPLATVMIEPDIDITVGETYIGSEESDEYTGTTGPDFVFTQDGNDTIEAGHGEGDDHYDGGDGDEDEITYLSAENGVVINLVDSTVRGVDIGIDTIASLERFATGDGPDTLVIGPEQLAQDFFWDAGGGRDTVQFHGALNVDTATFDAEIEEIEVVDLNKTHANVFTISVDDFIDVENDTSSLQIRGGPDDVVNLTDLENPDDGEPGGYYEGYWYGPDNPPSGVQLPPLGFDPAPQGFDAWYFVDSEDNVLAVAHIEHGIQVNTQINNAPVAESIYGSKAINSEFSPSFVNIDLTADAVADINSSTGLFALGGELVSIDAATNREFVFGYSGTSNPGDGSTKLVLQVQNTNGQVQQVTLIATERGWYDSNGFHSTSNDNYIAGELSGVEHRNFFVFDLSSIYGEVLSAELQLFNNNSGFVSPQGTETYVLHSVSTSISDLINGTGGLAAFEDLGGTSTNVAVLDSDPLILDLNGDGVRFGGEFVSFDFNGNGDAERIGWTNGEDGLLVVDANGDGVISSGEEIVSPEMVEGASDSIEALATFDGNGDGIIDAQDARFDELSVWRDANQNGVTDDGELASLNDMGIESISLDVSGVTVVDANGNVIESEGSFTYSDGSSGVYSQVTFALDTQTGDAAAGTMIGGDGDDVISGTGEADIIAGGGGDNILSGGPGADTFVVTGLNDGIDTIADYEEGLDTLDVTGLLADALPDSLPDGQELGGIIGDFVQAISDGENTTVSVDVDGPENGANFTEIAVLQGVGAGADITVKIDDQQVTVESAALNV